MKKDKLNNEELPIENLFREAFDNHKEPIEEKDFDQFLNQLEETGYFNKNKKRPFFLFIIGLSILGAIILYFLINSSSNKSSEKKVPTIQNTSLNNSEQLNNSTNSNLEKDSIEVKSGNKDKGLIKEGDHNPRTRNQTDPKANQSSNLDQTGNLVPLDVKEPMIDSVQKQYTEVKKTLPKDSVRIKYIMKVDTIKNIDSLNINKKKWSKIKGKK